MKRFIPLLMVACGATATPPRKPYVELPKDPPCSQPVAESDFRNVRPFRNYVELRSITPLEHHFLASWKGTRAGRSAFAVRRNPTTGEIDVRSESDHSGIMEIGSLEEPRFPPVPHELHPFLEEIRRRATSEDLPRRPRSLDFGYLGEYRLVELREMMPLGPAVEPQLTIFDSVTFRADGNLTQLDPSSATERGLLFHPLCRGGVCGCDSGRWVAGLPPSTPDGTLLLSRSKSDPTLQAHLLEAARRVDAGAKDATLARLLADDSDTGLLPTALEQRLSLDLTVMPRPKQPGGDARSNDLELQLDARRAVFGTVRATKTTSVDGVELTISATLSSVSPPAEGHTKVALDLVVRVEDGRGGASERRYRRRLDALIENGNVAITEYEFAIGEKDQEEARHVLPGGRNTANIELFVGPLRPVFGRR